MRPWPARGRALLTAPAIYRDEDKLHTYRGPSASKASIDIYSCAGKLIRSINVRPLTLTLTHARAHTHTQGDSAADRHSGTRAPSRGWAGPRTRSCWW
jgi:hypothetical protein